MISEPNFHRDPNELDIDERFMESALELARRGLGWVEPNPMVGCVLVRKNEIIGQGFHGKFGGPHAEIAALRSLGSIADAKGATAYVTLEPCCHFGKTPPCADALIEAGIARVVIAMEDPFDKVSGGGIRRLRDAGIDVVVGVLNEKAADLNAAFIKRVRTGRPWVIAKWAMTIDGKIATASGQSQWITGESARAAVHELRGRVDAIVVGMGTVIADDPTLTARPPGPRTATRVVFCRHRLPRPNSKLVQTASEVPVKLIVGREVDFHELDQLRSLGLDVVACGETDAGGMVDAFLRDQFENGATNVMLEGGAELFSTFFSAHEVDECHVFLGPKAFGSAAAPGPIGGDGVELVSHAWHFELQSMDRFDSDVRLIYRR